MMSLNEQTHHLFSFDSDVFNTISHLASISNTTPECVGVACYVAFLGKLTGGKRDFSIWQNTNSQYRSDLYEAITMLSNRVIFHLDPHASFIQLIQNIHTILTQTADHRTTCEAASDTLILLDLSLALRAVYIRTKIQCQSSNDHLLGEIHPLLPSATPDFSVIIQYDLEKNNVSCAFDASSELFAHRFHTMCQQLFSSSFDSQLHPIYQLSILLPTEQNILRKLDNSRRRPADTCCIHQAFTQQALQHPSKIAVVLDDQSLTYQQLLTRVRHLSFILIKDKGIKTGDTVCQYIDRSLDMIVGIMSIMMAGGVYAPLSVSDPVDRLQALVHQVNAKLILVNRTSYRGVSSLSIPILDISEINDTQVEELSQVNVTPDSISHIVFTSGSTGVPKAVQIRHRNFMDYIQTQVIQTEDVVIQLTSSTFDSHLDDIHGALVHGAQLVMLKPGGQFDLDYLTQTIFDKKVTYVGPVPSWINALGKFLAENQHAQHRVKSVKYWYLGGETLLSSMIVQFLPFADDQARFFNLYGPAEITIVATRYEIRREELSGNVTLPIGDPLDGYRIHLLDEYRQPVIPGQMGEIFIGGVGVFAGYYGRNDLTSQVLVEVENEECYATGDLGRLDVENGELYFAGRRDYQVKLRGQRIEVGEIEETVVKGSTLVTGCIVMKIVHHEEEHLVCYVEAPSDKIKEDDLRNECRSSLAHHMVPSKFIILDRFPLTVNGKVNRKALPSADFSSITRESEDTTTPLNDMEKRVQNLWCQVLGEEEIPINRSFFALHGSSLLFMKLYNHYQIEFGRVPDVVTCLRQATIREHAQLLLETIASTNANQYQAWPSLKINEAEASFAQSRIILDEQIRMHLLTEQHATVYNIPLLYRLSEGCLSIKDLRRALQKIALKHTVLRTSVQLNGNLTQRIHSENDRDWFIFCTTFGDENVIKKIFMEEMTNQRYFDVSQGHVCRCHIVCHRSSISDSDVISTGDWIIFNFHHAAFDGESERIFLDELRRFYSNEQEQDALLQYIDYSAHERQLDMTSAKAYWRQALLDYNLKKPINLPFDRQVSSNSIRTGQGLSIDIQFDKHIAEQLIDFASKSNTTLYQVCLTIYYIFLFKLTGGQRDLIVGIVHANRYRPELQHLIGMFANTLPMRVRVNPQDTFEELLTKVSNLFFEAHEHFHLPYQMIIEQIPRGQNLIQTMFTLDELSVKSIRLDETCSIDFWPISRLNDRSTSIGTHVHVMSMFDMSLALEYTMETNELRAELMASTDLFDPTTISDLAKRFQLVVEQLFSSTTTVPSICDLSLYLPGSEVDLIGIEAVAEQRRDMKAASDFWREMMFEYDWNHQSNLPIGHPQTFSLTLNQDLTQAFADYASAREIPLSALFLTCYYVFLFKLTNNETDLCIGTRTDQKEANVIPLRFQIEPNRSFDYCVHRVAKLDQQCKKYGSFPYQRILETLTLPSEVSLDIHFDFQTVGNPHLEPVLPTLKFILGLTVKYDPSSNIICTFDGSSQATMETLAHRFQTMCEQLFSSSFDPQLHPIYQLSILLPIEQNILRKLDNTSKRPTDTCCLHQAFTQQALQHPSKIAVVLDDQSLTYQQLLTRVRHLSFILINDKGIRTGDTVCQYIDRSLDMIVGIMGIMMAGGVYVPLSVSDPIDRLQSLVRQVNAKLILVNRMSCAGVSSLNTPFVDISEVVESPVALNGTQLEALLRVDVTPESISHIMFTSGSTGVPKAVQIRHRNFKDYIRTHIIQAEDVVLQLTSSTFDSHLDDIHGALLRGAQLVMLKAGGQFDLDYLTQTIYDKKVTYVGPVPSWINALGKFLAENQHAQHRVKSVKCWYLGGETLLSSMVDQLLPFADDQAKFFNLYGPAEITIVATCHKIRREELSSRVTVPIGYPLDGYRIHLLDEYRQPVVPGQMGEIFIGGVGVFAGYYGRKDLTSKVLVQIENEECYATGDLGRLDVERDELLFAGRRDHQVKLRGQRIELSTIELMIVRSSSNISNCIVAKEGCGDDDDHLVAYVEVKQSIDRDQLQTEIFHSCSSQLPAYMIPTKWVFVFELPLNVNGKIDRKKLREVEEIQSSIGVAKTISPLEQKLQDIFMRAFHLPSLPDVRVPFGLLGGTSVGAMRALNLIRQEIAEKMDIGLLFTNPSVAALAAALKPIIGIAESGEVKRINAEDDNFAPRLRSSWLIESVGIIVLVWVWLWPILMAIRFQLNCSAMLLVPLIHLMQYPLFVELFGGPFSRGRDTLYSWRYYRLWFLRRLWFLNTYWLGYLLGTPFYTSYLRLCGARIEKGTHIYSTHIDAPWLLKIGNSTYIGDEVILSSLAYHDRIYELHEIHIGSHCSIGARCVLHDRVDMQDGVLVEPLTAVTGRIIGQQQGTASLCIFTQGQALFQLVALLTMFSIHAVILRFGWFVTNWLPVGWLLWIVLGSIVGLLLLWCAGNVEPNFSHPLNSWTFLVRFWLRQLIIHSFGTCLSSVFDGTDSFTPLALRWLGVTIENNDVYIDEIIPVLAVPPSLLTINCGVTTTSSVRFVPFEVTTDGQCTVTGPIRIGSRSFIANRCLLRSGACLLEDMLVGSLTRIDSASSNTKQGDILFGIPARPMPFTSSSIEESIPIMPPERSTKRAFYYDFQTLINEFINVLLFAICATLVLKVTSGLYVILLAVPAFLWIYSWIITTAYVRSINNKSETNLFVPTALSLISFYGKWIDSFLGGTQWLIVVLRRFGARIDDDVIIDDMNCVEDIHLITLGSHVRLSSTSRIQCHTFEQRTMKYRPVKIGPTCILKPMSLVLPGVNMMGSNYLMPCSVVLPHDQLVAHTDWSGSPAKRMIVHHSLEPPQFILAARQSSLGAYDVVVGRFHDDTLTLYFGEDGWLGWQTGIDLRRPFQPSDLWIKLFFTGFLCQPQANRVLIFGLGGGILPTLIRHYFPSVIIDVVEVDETVIELALDFFGLAEQMTDGHLNIFAEDACLHVSKTNNQYDIIFVDVFSDETMPTHVNTEDFFTRIRKVLNSHGCLLTNANLSSTAYQRLTQVLSSTFDANILFAHNNIVENARIIISGSQQSVVPIATKERAIAEAQQLESNAQLEFSIARLLSLAYGGPLASGTYENSIPT